MKTGKKLFGPIIMTVMVMLAVSSVLVAALVTYDSITTGAKSPGGIELTKGTDEWTTATFYDDATTYDVAVTAAYGTTAGLTYYITVDAAAVSGTIASGDFTVALTGDITAAMTEVSPGHWHSALITVATSDVTDAFAVTITPNVGSVDLTQVSWTITAVDTVA